MIEQKRIAEEATFQVACAMEYIDWLRSVLYVLRDRLDEQQANKHYGLVADLAIVNAEDWHNQLDVERESLEKRVQQVFGHNPIAPQGVDRPNRVASGPGRTLAERLAWARNRASLSQLELAQAAGVKQATISHLESGKTRRTAYLPEIARACGADIGWLAFGTEGAQ